MTPEDIEQLKQLKQLFDDGVLTAEEFAIQKNLILASPQNAELANGESQDKSAHTASNASDSSKEVFETSSGEDKYAVMRDMLASGALEAKNLSQETLSLVYGKQEDGLSTKQQNPQSVGGSQGTSATQGLGVADAIRALHASKEANISGTAASSTAGAAEIVRAFKEANVLGTAASSSGTSKTKKLVLTFTAIILIVLVVVVSVIVGGSNDSAKTDDAENSSVVVSTPDTVLTGGGGKNPYADVDPAEGSSVDDQFIDDLDSLYDKFISAPDEQLIESGVAVCLALRNGASGEQVVYELLSVTEGDAEMEDFLKKLVASAVKNFCPDQQYKFIK